MWGRIGEDKQGAGLRAVPDGGQADGTLLTVPRGPIPAARCPGVHSCSRRTNYTPPPNLATPPSYSEKG